jgi:hypothetical protein
MLYNYITMHGARKRTKYIDSVFVKLCMWWINAHSKYKRYNSNHDYARKSPNILVCIIYGNCLKSVFI